MADLPKIQQVRNDGVAWTKTAGAASQTMVYDRSDDKIILLVENGGGADCRIKVKANGFGAGGTDLNVDITDGEFAVIGPLESNRFKEPATQKVTFEILDQDDTAYSGTVGSVLVTQLNAPLALVD